MHPKSISHSASPSKSPSIALCALCGREFSCPPSRLNKAIRVFCSLECSDAFKRGKELRPFSERFAEKIKRRPDGCWEWTGTKTVAGYGQIKVDRLTQYSHRVSYEFHKGPITEGLHLDHLCRNPCCVNPDHLEPVTPLENSLRGENEKFKLYLQNDCKRGHGNVRVTSTGFRYCPTCARLAYQRAKSKANVSG